MIDIRSKSKEQLNERRAGLSNPEEEDIQEHMVTVATGTQIPSSALDSEHK